MRTCALKGCLAFPTDGEMLFCRAHSPENDYMWEKRATGRGETQQ